MRTKGFRDSLFDDIGAIVLSFRLAYFVRFEAGLFVPESTAIHFSAYYPAILLAVGVWTFLFFTVEVRGAPAVQGSSIRISQFFTAFLFLVVMLLVGLYLFGDYRAHLLFLPLAVLLMALLGTIRLAYGVILDWLGAHGIGLRRVVIVGQATAARELESRIRCQRDLRYQLVGVLSPTKNGNGLGNNGAVAGGSLEIVRKLVAKRVDELIFAIPLGRESKILEFIADCQNNGIAVKLVPECYELHLNQVGSGHIGGIPVLELKETSLNLSYRFLKRMMDGALALVFLILSLPIMIPIAIALYLISAGHVIKRETRIGLGGRPFVMYRFDVETVEVFRSREDPGWSAWLCGFLHRYSFSELPQLWNVLLGHMSIVGPRPETPERVRHYSSWHRRRLRLKPGITGLAQVQGVRGVDSSDLKTEYDLEYAARYTPFLDVTLILATVNTLLRRRKGAATRTTRAPLIIRSRDPQPKTTMPLSVN